MIEEQILGAIAEKIDSDSLNLQVITQEQTLYLYINRGREADLDYDWLTAKIQDAVTGLTDCDFTLIELYSRIFGEVEPDWHTSLELVAADLESITSEIAGIVEDNQTLTLGLEQKPEVNSFANAEVESLEESETSEEVVANSESIVVEPGNQEQTLLDSSEETIQDSEASKPDQEEEEKFSESPISPEDNPEAAIVDFSQYCFIRNRSLLEAELVSPSANLAELITTFDEFSALIKRSQLPLLEAYLKQDQSPEIEELEPPVKAWWTEILALDGDPKRKFAIWMSRYCCDCETTMTKISGILAYQEEVEKANQAEIREQASQKCKTANQAHLESSQSSDESESAENLSQPKSKSNSKSKKKSSVALEAFLSALIFIGVVRPVFRSVINSFSNSTSSDSETVELATATLETENPNQDSVNLELNKNNVEMAKGSAIDYAEDNFASEEDKLNYVIKMHSAAWLKYEDNSFGDALKIVNRLIEKYPDDFEKKNRLAKAYHLQGLVHHNLNDYQRAIDSFGEAIKLYKFKDSYYADRSLVHMDLGNYTAAYEDINHALKLNRRQLDWFFYRSRINYRNREYEAALKDINKVIAKGRFYLPAFEQRYNIHNQLSNRAEADWDYRKIQQLRKMRDPDYEPNKTIIQDQFKKKNEEIN